MLKAPFTGETNHRWKYTTGFSGTEDDEAYEGASCRESRMYVVRAGRSEGEAMREDELAGHIPETEDEQPQERSFGCLFCITGKEQSIVDQIQTSCPDVRATAMRQLKYRTCKRSKHRKKRFFSPVMSFLRLLQPWNRPSNFQDKISYGFCLRMMACGSCRARMNGSLNGFSSMMGCWVFHRHIKKTTESESFPGR